MQPWLLVFLGTKIIQPGSVCIAPILAFEQRINAIIILVKTDKSLRCTRFLAFGKQAHKDGCKMEEYLFH